MNMLRIKEAMPERLRVEIAPPSGEPMLWVPDQMLRALGDAQARSRQRGDPGLYFPTLCEGGLPPV